MSDTPRTRTEMIMQIVRRLGSSMTLNANGIRGEIEQEVAALETDLMQQASANARLTSSLSEVTNERDEQRKVLDAIYDCANETLKAASRNLADWVDNVEHIGLLAAEEEG